MPPTYTHTMSDQSRKRGPSVSKPGTNEAVQNSSLELGDDAKVSVYLALYCMMLFGSANERLLQMSGWG